MEKTSKDQNSIEDLNSKLNDFLSEDFEICPENITLPETDEEPKTSYNESKANEGSNDIIKMEKYPKEPTPPNEPNETEEKFLKMKVDNDLAGLKKRAKERSEQNTQPQINTEPEPISDDELSNSLKNFLGKLNNSK